mmetsp:Transcript_47413/g.76048  ORF Transcript_47413/g.76048 Transcript_47413/m.76048 type:complete len:669 (+) Transcript_47413:75-2081(+)
MASLPQEKVNVQLARLGGNKESFEVDLHWTVNVLLEAICSKYEIPKQSIKLLCKGKMLSDEKLSEKTLKSLKIKAADKIIVMNKPQIKKKTTNVDTDSNSKQQTAKQDTHSVDNVIQRRKNIEEIKLAAESLAARDNDGYDWNANYYIELTNQYGEKVQLPDEQRQALTVGLTLHEKGKKFMQEERYHDAIYIMNLAFESFERVNQQFLHSVDNYGLLALDIVWCYYLAQDETNLINAGKWLQIAEFGLQRAHGKNLERIRQLRGDFVPELSLYVRLNILRALQSFYGNDMSAAQQHLLNAEMDLRKLTISDIDLVKLESMGFSHTESRRALRFCAGDIERAITHIYAKRDEQEQKQQQERERAQQRRLQRKYGATKSGKFVDLNLLQQLQGMGVEREIAVEALRQTDNNGEETLNLCTDPDRKEVLAQTLFARYLNEKHADKVEHVQQVMGHDNVSEPRVRAALFLTFHDVEQAITMLSAPDAQQVVELDRVELRFVAYVQKRQEMLLQRAKQESLMQQQQQQQQLNDDDKDDENDTNMADNEEQDEEEANGDEMEQDANVVDPAEIQSKAMPNPHLGDKNVEQEEEQKLVDKFKPIGYHVPDEDDRKIEQHILDDLDNDEEAYLDIDLTTEQDALQNLKVLLSSMQMNANASTQDDQQPFLSLFKK